MNIYYVYAYLRTDGTPYYIGKGKANRAFRKRNNRGINPPIDKSRIKFIHKNLLEEDAFKLEIAYIKLYGRKDLLNGILLNRTAGGEGATQQIISKKTRNRISNSLKGRTVTEKTRKKLSEKAKGRTVSEETRKKLSFHAKNISEETRKKLSEKAKGRTVSEETRKKMSEARKKYWNGAQGRTRTYYDSVMS